jgi:endonuclease/exonuclease/phosphatase family metal-dependent hydrolase
MFEACGHTMWPGRLSMPAGVSAAIAGRRMIVRLLVTLVLLAAASPAWAADLVVATWNLEWLTTRPDGDPGLPPDAHPKRPEDIATLAGYAARLNADLVAIQEVDGREVAARIFPPDRYSIHMTHDHVTQRVGLVVRQGIQYDINPDVPLVEGATEGSGTLRSGADITLRLPGEPLRVLAVHLKAGCDRDRLTHSRRPACAVLHAQLPLLQRWIAARRQEGAAFLVLGDFNRWMDGNDEVIAALRQAAPLARATEGHASPCWGGEHFIDHILAGGPAADWMQPATLTVQVFRETRDEWKERLSDHCAVTVRFHPPG